MIKLWAITKNTFTQTTRQPLYGILVLATFAVLVISLPLTGWTMGTDYHASDQKMLENLGLSTLLVSGLFLAAFSASGALSREIEDRTALTVISKPVWRGTFVLGKFAGVAAAVAAAFYLCGLVFLLTVRHRVMPAAGDPYDWPVIVLGLSAFGLSILVALAGNFFFGWSFVSAGFWSCLVLMSAVMGVLTFLGKGWQIVPPGHDTPENLAIHAQLIVGMVLIFLAVLVFVAVAIAAGTRLGQVMTLLVCSGVFFVGAMHPYLFGYWADRVPAARLLGWIAPNLTYFFPLDALVRDQIIPLSYVAVAAAYCALYVGAVLTIGMGLFQRRQLEAQTSSATLPGPVALLGWAGRTVSAAGAIVALVLLSVRGFHTPRAIAAIAGLLAGAVLNWMLWFGFSKGRRWAYRLAALLAASALAGLTATIVLPAFTQVALPKPASVGCAVGDIAAALVVLVLLLPRTRRHFSSSARIG